MATMRREVVRVRRATGLGLTLALALGAATAGAQDRDGRALGIALVRDADLPEVHSASHAMGVDPEPFAIGAAMGIDPQPFQDAGEVSGIEPEPFVVWVFDRRTGLRVGAPLVLSTAEALRGATPVDVLYSTRFMPGSVLLLDTALAVHELRIGFGADGTPFLRGTAVHDFAAFFPDQSLGHGTALAELGAIPPNDDQPWLALGTDTGNLVLATFDPDAAGGIIPCMEPVGSGPIVDLAVVPQVGTFAFVALVDGRDGQRLVGLAPPDDNAPPQIAFDLVGANPPDDNFVGLAGLNPPDDSMPLEDPAPVHLVAANGTRLVHRLTIPADAILEHSFDAAALEPLATTASALAVGSLALVPGDGSGVLYDPRFDLDRGGVSGTLLTLLGSSLELHPLTVKRTSRGRWITAYVEVAQGGAAAIDPASILLELGGGTLWPDPAFAPKLGDADGDGNPDLAVKLDRAAFQSWIPAGATEVTATARWQFADGAPGFASGAVRVLE
jgi:hypothetical protein